MSSEINPNHPVTTQMRSEWHKVVAMLMRRYAITEFEITVEDMLAYAAVPEMAVVADQRNGRFVIRLIPMDEAMKLAREQGGFPQ